MKLLVWVFMNDISISSFVAWELWCYKLGMKHVSPISPHGGIRKRVQMYTYELHTKSARILKACRYAGVAG